MPQKVVIVEDDDLVRLNAASLFEDAGLSVFEFKNADEARQFFESGTHDVAVVFTDVEMPGSIDGIDLANWIAGVWPAMKILVTSGKSPRQLPQTATFMPKPWRPEAVLAHVTNIVS